MLQHPFDINCELATNGLVAVVQFLLDHNLDPWLLALHRPVLEFAEQFVINLEIGFQIDRFLDLHFPNAV